MNVCPASVLLFKISILLRKSFAWLRYIQSTEPICSADVSFLSQYISFSCQPFPIGFPIGDDDSSSAISVTSRNSDF